MKYILIVLLSVSLQSCLSSKIDRQTAIKIAEQYVEENGYAARRINLDSARTPYDIVELMGMTKEQVADSRHNRLLPKAYSATRHWGKWWVTFQYNQEKYPGLFEGRDYESGKMVSMNRRGKRIRTHHQDVFIKHR